MKPDVIKTEKASMKYRRFLIKLMCVLKDINAVL